ncbi:phage protein NinX family protein [Alcanivorax jadensis]|uniref:phage protein NinX family protein n=1 Tax=Alcanivorax jadensis TaxID=64988 RepID=UPI0023528E43|nr:phage protein NinX family protein [Alcanivorax jadensis]|tara:strand:+ start:136 stop:555 length:420 start_codon:yes stop_codon:yes gene_type:complete
MTKRVAIAELEGAALDWAVATSTGLPVYDMESDWPGIRAINEAARHGPVIIFNLVRRLFIEDQDGSRAYSPTTDWSQCGPLIERYKIAIMGPNPTDDYWTAWAGPMKDGPTPLIAACRAIVAAHSPSGFVEVPDELAHG